MEGQLVFALGPPSGECGEIRSRHGRAQEILLPLMSCVTPGLDGCRRSQPRPLPLIRIGPCLLSFV